MKLLEKLEVLLLLEDISCQLHRRLLLLINHMKITQKWLTSCHHILVVEGFILFGV